MTNNIMCSLGKYRFISNENPFDEISKAIKYNFASHDRYLETERLQYKGRKATSITLNITVVVSKDSDNHIISDIEKLGNNGQPMALIVSNDDSGGFAGDWVVTDISSTRKTYIKGVAFEQKATISLKEWVND